MAEVKARKQVDPKVRALNSAWLRFRRHGSAEVGTIKIYRVKPCTAR